MRHTWDTSGASSQDPYESDSTAGSALWNYGYSYNWDSAETTGSNPEEDEQEQTGRFAIGTWIPDETEEAERPYPINQFTIPLENRRIRAPPTLKTKQGFS